ncbi:TrbC/VirB2 family protein [Dyella sp. A6]|uniref:TrbC/VirB2 family protein n=1 Tax=Dyella aluminiiresistens TaxID=3069105 RepID=UPI002E7934EA|nr:TrbC/VirB2 family protein [Dyella sp. A6]
MTPNIISSTSKHQSSQSSVAFAWRAMLVLLLIPGMALAQTASDTATTTCGFFNNVDTVLNAVSIIVVTIAIIFTGYKVAFAHARISEVAPVLIGAILIGAAGQIAKMFLSNSAGSSACSAPTTMVTHFINNYADLARHLLIHYA